MMVDANPWAWWQAALANPKEIGKSLGVHDGDPQQGYYRVRYGKTKPFERVALWHDEDGWNGRRNGKEINAGDIWTSCCQHPITHAQYLDHEKTGRWHDDDAVVAGQVAEKTAPSPKSAEIGDNSGDVSEAEALKDQIAAALKNAEKYATVGDDETASKAVSMRNRLNELSNEANKIREKEKAPFLEGGKKVDAAWQPLVKGAKEGADKVRDALSAWETKKLQERRKAEAAEAERQLAESAKSTVDAQQPSLAPEAAPAETAGRISGAYGKSASVTAKLVVKSVTDWKALAVYMSAHAEMQTLLKALAQRALDAGRTEIPGVETEEVASVR